MYGKIEVPLKTKKINYNLTRLDEWKNVKTNKIYSKKEITTKNKTAENTATPQALVLNPYVTKTFCTVNKLKNTSIKTRPPLKNPNTPYQSICNTAIEWNNTNKQKEHRTICTTQLSDRDKRKIQSKIKMKDSSKIQQVSATYTNNFPADENVGLSSKAQLDHIHFSSQIDIDEPSNKHNYTILNQTKVQKPNQQLLIINQHRYRPLHKPLSTNSTKDLLFQYKENDKTIKQNFERMKEAMVSNSAKGSRFCNSGGILIIPRNENHRRTIDQIHL